MKYNVKKTIIKGIEYLALVAIPLYFDATGISSMTIGTLYIMAKNWYKNR